MTNIDTVPTPFDPTEDTHDEYETTDAKEAADLDRARALVYGLPSRPGTLR